MRCRSLSITWRNEIDNFRIEVKVKQAYFQTWDPLYQRIEETWDRRSDRHARVSYVSKGKKVDIDPRSFELYLRIGGPPPDLNHYSSNESLHRDNVSYISLLFDESDFDCDDYYFSLVVWDRCNC